MLICLSVCPTCLLHPLPLIHIHTHTSTLHQQTRWVAVYLETHCKNYRLEEDVSHRRTRKLTQLFTYLLTQRRTDATPMSVFDISTRILIESLDLQHRKLCSNKKPKCSHVTDDIEVCAISTKFGTLTQFGFFDRSNR